MPGILPMKVIKVGSTLQSRIAQACDRCRSKKIRCDGIRPCCSQCANVGFECKTSDKLSRRAFPRGYTESLEDRVRALETEIRELKDLLDEKDEKIDMLSRMHSNKRPSVSSSASQSPVELLIDPSNSTPKEDFFRVQASPLLLGVENSDSYFMGASSGRAFVEAFKRKVQESGRSIDGVNTDAFLNTQGDSTPSSQPSTPESPCAPPRMFSDRCVNIFFQEWAPLFPVLHKPSFLRLYEEYVSNPEELTDPHQVAQLNLVFGIAGLSSNIPEKQHIASCEQQWHSALETVLMENTLATLQCLSLALIYCILKSDYKRLQHYKCIAIGLSHRLGLHQNQQRFSLGALTAETRKRVFWTLYTIDCFSAALLGLPKLWKEEDIHAEYPSDTDDEYVTEKGFLPTLPGEYTKISSALALFRAARILSKVLEKNYPAAATHDLSLQSLTSLDSEIKEWSDSLPIHLKLTFVQDKPSTDVTGNRSALLSLAYYYIRSLIHLPAVGSALGHKSSPSVMSLADSSKHIIQIVQLLEERRMSFSFCLNKNAMLTLCGLSLLYQGLDLKQEGKLMRDGQRLVLVVIDLLEKGDAPGATDFKRLASSVLRLDKPKQVTTASTNGASNPSKSVSPQATRAGIYRHVSASISESELLHQQERTRRMTDPNTPQRRHNEYLYHGRNSLDSTRSESPISRREYPVSVPQAPNLTARPRSMDKTPNLDYLSLNNTPSASQPQSPGQSRQRQPIHTNTQTPTIPNPPSYPNIPKRPAAGPTEWEILLGALDGGQTNLYDAIYGGPALSLPDSTPSTLPGDWSPDSQWDISNLTVSDFHPPQSVLSFSDESLSSGEDLSMSDLGTGTTNRDFGMLAAGSWGGRA